MTNDISIYWNGKYIKKSVIGGQPSAQSSPPPIQLGGWDHKWSG